jgi:hypothetical protein
MPLVDDRSISLRLKRIALSKAKLSAERSGQSNVQGGEKDVATISQYLDHSYWSIE